MRSVLRWSIVLALPIALVWARWPQVVAQSDREADRPERATQTGRFRNPLLTESSGVAASRRNSGVLWTHNDSGREPWLFATDTLGADHGRFRVSGAENLDWEDVALGPCGPRSCVYIADTGDNREGRAALRIYRVSEPTPRRGARFRATLPAERIEFRYPDGRHDTEALYVDRAGDVYLITKGRTGPVQLFRVPAAAWDTTAVVTAERLESLPIDPATALGRWVTGAALSPDGAIVAVRTYRDIYFFRRGDDGRLTTAGPPRMCDIVGLETQGEGIDWLDDETLVLTSESALGTGGAVSVVRCPLP